MFLAHYWRSQTPLEPLTPGELVDDVVTAGNTTDTELAVWFNENFAGFWTMYFPAATIVSYLFFFGIGGYLHVSIVNRVSHNITLHY